MGFWNKLFGLPEKEDGVFTVSIPKKTMVEYGWSVEGGQVSVKMSRDKIIVTKVA